MWLMVASLDSIPNSNKLIPRFRKSRLQNHARIACSGCVRGPEIRQDNRFHVYDIDLICLNPFVCRCYSLFKRLVSGLFQETGGVSCWGAKSQYASIVSPSLP